MLEEVAIFVSETGSQIKYFILHISNILKENTKILLSFKVRVLLKAMTGYEDDISNTPSLENKLNIYGNYFSDINEALQIVKEDVKNDQHSTNDAVVSS